MRKGQASLNYDFENHDPDPDLEWVDEDVDDVEDVVRGEVQSSLTTAEDVAVGAFDRATIKITTTEQVGDSDD